MPDKPQQQEVILDPQFSRPFQVNAWTGDPALAGLVQELWDEHFAEDEAGKQQGGRKPTRPYIEQLRVVIADLYLAWQEEPHLCIGVSFSASAWDSHSRYNPQSLSKHIVTLIKKLEKARLVRVSAASYAAPGAPGNRTSRIQASSKLQERFAALPVDPRQVMTVPLECIVLKGQDGKDVEYEDSDGTNRMRAELVAYNDLLAGSFIDIPTLENPWITRTDDRGREIKVPLGPYNQRVRRIFSRGSWEMNGRFYRFIRLTGILPPQPDHPVWIL